MGRELPRPSPTSAAQSTPLGGAQGRGSPGPARTRGAGAPLVTCRCCSFRRAVFRAAAGSVLTVATTFQAPAQARRSVKCMGPVTSFLPCSRGLS